MGETIDTDRGSRLICPYCGYDLRVLTGDACPECGGAVDEASLKAAQVPWQSRREIGRLRVFIRTAGRVMFRTKRFCHAVVRPVDYKDARRFQFWVVTLVWLSLLSIVAPPVLINLEDVNQAFSDVGQGLAWGCVLAGAVGLWLFLFFATGVHTYWLHPKHISVERQNRAVAIGYYACGPLLLTVPGCLIMVAGMFFIGAVQPYDSSTTEVIASCIMITGILVIVVGMTSCWRVCFVMAARVADHGPVGRWSLPVVQPLLVVVMALLLPVGLPTVVWCLTLVAKTF